MALEMLATQDFLLQSLLALAIGGLIGFEREQSYSGRAVGVRTLALDAWLGFLLAILGRALGEPLLPVAGLAGVFAVAYAHHRSRVGREQALGITTTLVIPLTYLLGALAGIGFVFEAGASALLVTFVLAEKQQVHTLVAKVSRREIVDFLILAISAFIVYPLLPAKPVEFLTIQLDLRYFWTIVVLVSVVSFGGYALVRILRERALLLAAFFGGFVSALAVVAWFARDKRATPQAVRLNLEAAMAGSLLSDSLVLAYASFTLLYHFAGPLLATLLAFVTLSFFHSRGTKMKGALAWEKPLSLLFALEFGAVFFGISLLVELAAKAGLLGLYAGSFVGGLLSLTGAIATIAHLHGAGQIPSGIAVLALFIALVANLGSKLVLVVMRFPGRWAPAAQPIAISLAAGVLGLLASLYLA
jgi:uncharacterized membrane protein (DUF4010 family)